MGFLKKKKNNNFHIFIAFTLVSFAIFYVAYVLKFDQLINSVEIITYDWRARIATSKNLSFLYREHSKDIILLNANDESFKALSQYPELAIGRWPWPRKIWGDVINFISRSNPKAIVFDIKFEGAQGETFWDKQSDNYFANSVKDKNVIIGVALSYPRSRIAKEINTLIKKQNLKEDQIDKLIYKITGFSPLTLNPNLFADIETMHSLNIDRDYKLNLFNHITFYDCSFIYKKLMDNVKKVGIINLKSSENMIARYHVPLYRLVNGKEIFYIPSLPLATVLSILPDKEKTAIKLEKNKIVIANREIPIDSQGKFLISWYGSAGTYESIPVAKVILTDALRKKKIKNLDSKYKILPDVFKDKIIVIGQTSAGSDIHPTSMGMAYPGPEIVTTVIDNILNDISLSSINPRKIIKKAPFFTNLFIVILFCSCIIFFNLKTKSNLSAISWFLLIIVLFILFSIFLFVMPLFRIWINMVYPLIFMSLSVISVFLYKAYSEESQKRSIEKLFGKFVSPQVLKKLLNDPKSINKNGERKNMTVLFSDLRNFTSLTEKTPVNDLINQLNEYFSEMVEIILKYNGTMDKFMGDCIMAFYGDPLPLEYHSLMSIASALEMQEKLALLNKKWEKEEKPFLKMGIGINSGEMIVGHIGSQQIIDYTVMGDNVNIAQRVEGLTKEYGVPIIISEYTYLQSQKFIQVSYLGEIVLRGKQQPTRIYQVNGLSDLGKKFTSKIVSLTDV